MRHKSIRRLPAIALLTALCVVAIPGYGASDLFISEYVEGSSYNKAIEIFNSTGQSIDLTTYQLQYYYNGATTAGRTITLSGTLADGDVYVLAEDAADPALRDQADFLDTSISWYNGDDAIVLLHNGIVIDAIGQVGFDPGSQWGSGDTGTQNHTLRRIVCEGDSDAYDVFDPALQWQGYPQDTFDGIGSHTCNSEPPPAPANVFIHDIQGSGAGSPLVGQTVAVDAIVIADFQGSNRLSGFFIQEEDADSDGDPLTSEGLFVYNGIAVVDVSVGDRVKVTGTVSEYHNLTELSNVTVEVLSQANPLPMLSNIQLPVVDAQYLERYEGMRVYMPQVLTVTENYDLGRYGEVWLSSAGRLMTPTAVATPGTAAVAQQAGNDLNRILLDDFSSAQNPEPIIYPAPQLTALNSLRSGDSVTGVTGVLSYGFGAYLLQPTQMPDFVADNARTPKPQSISGRLKVASFNVLNYFNGDGQGGGFPTARGADTQEEFDRQRSKIIAAITAMQADIIGLMEIENDGYGVDSAIADLVNGLNAVAPVGTGYAFINPGVSQIGTDQISVGIIYRSQTVQPMGPVAILDSSVDARFIDTKNRPTLAQTFKEVSSDALLTVAVNHLKSKGSDCNSLNDPDIGDGQGNCNLTRTAAAQALVDWLATDPTASGDSDFLIIGDLNAYAKEDPVSAIKAGGYTDLIDRYIGAAQAYSYVFAGQSGYLDHALASGTLARQVRGITEWHINADEPHVLDYNTEYKSVNQISDLYNTDPYRASDHDPVIIGLDLSPPPPKSVHVSDLDVHTESKHHAKHRWLTSVIIQVQDDRGGRVAGVEIAGSLVGKHRSQATACVTDALGTCSVPLPTRIKGLPREFTVTNLSHTSLSYDPISNSDVDGDSDGTTIKLDKELKHGWRPRLKNHADSGSDEKEVDWEN